jgi:hypothetical protein
MRAGTHRSRRTFIAQGAAAFALGTSVDPRTALAALAASTQPAQLPTPVPLGTIAAGGDLAHRAGQNFTRLEMPLYRPPQLFNGQNVRAWPGDFEGRALLAITLMSRATGQEPDYLPAMVAEYKAHLNSQGCFGEPLDLKAINEQQLSGHGWFLRGLCEYYDFKRKPETLAQIQAIVTNLALPLRGSYSSYPIDPALRTRTGATGGINGHIAGQQAGWVISSDTGCAFIFLDGLTHAWVVLKAANDPSAPALKSLIDEAIVRFLQADLVAMQGQTHASLTALRALLRVYHESIVDRKPDAKLLAAVRDRYTLYRTVAMTEHYANYNWFGRPDSWTEPCAIIDSFMIATQLWQHTGDPAYLEDAHLIWTNGIGRGLRGNGGFGTDLCAGYRSPFLKLRSYEAPSCCTMRGGEGHARAIQYLYWTRPAELTVPFFSDSTVRLDLGRPSAPAPLVLRQTATYPYPGPVRIEVLSAALSSPIDLRLFVPQWTSQHRLTLNGRVVATTSSAGFLTVRLTPKSGDVLVLDFELRVAPRDTINPRSLAGYYAFEAGPLILGYRAPTATAATTPTTTAATPAPAVSAPLTAQTTPTGPQDTAQAAPQSPGAFVRSGRPALPPDPAEIHIARDAKLIMTAPGTYQIAGTTVVLSRINDLNDSSAAPRDPCTRQILFRES